MAALEDKYLGTARLEYAAVRRCAAFDNWAGWPEFLWLIRVAEREYSTLWCENFACVWCLRLIGAYVRNFGF